MQALPAELLNAIRDRSVWPPPPAVAALAERLRASWGDAVLAILFYGSCLRTGEDRGGMVDLYLIVERYHGVYSSPLWASLNKLLPPNVFYLEIPFEGRVVRAKYAVLSLADLEQGVSPAWFHSYIWGRFAQPTALVYTRQPAVADRVCALLGQAVLTFLARVIPRLPEEFSTEELWLRGLTLSYRTELRAERPEKMGALYHSAADHYARITAAALPALPFPAETIAGHDGHLCRARIDAARRIRCRFAWKVRSVQGKILTLLRLLKGAFTFTGGLDYILWKIERHTGLRVEVPPRLRRRPILALCVLGYRLYRRGAFR
ncbi:MAG: hypothetical protein MUF46_02385 [Desulfobacterales bacterium]|nr:hypothetical protein [Desulfobacterales bacterium]